MDKIIEFGAASAALKEEDAERAYTCAVEHYNFCLVNGDFEMLKYHLINGSLGISDYINFLEELPEDLVGFLPKLATLRRSFNVSVDDSLIQAIYDSSKNELLHALAEEYEFQAHEKTENPISGDEFLNRIEQIQKSKLSVYKPKESEQSRLR